MKVNIVRSLFFLILFSSVANGEEVIYLYTYHHKPPFIVDLEKRQGLYFDLAELLTKQVDNIQFKTVYLPRKRLDHMLKNNTLDGAVLGVSPVWFDDESMTKYLWLSPYYNDSDEFVSLKSSPFEYTGINSLKNKIAAGIAGAYYSYINEFVEEEQMLRIDTTTELNVFKLVKKRRADFGLVSRSTYDYIIKNDLVNDIYHRSKHPHSEFQRSGFVSLKNKEIYDKVKPLFEELQDNTQWQNLLDKYQ